MYQEPIHGTPMAVIKRQEGGLISLLQALNELRLGISVVLRGLFPGSSSRPQQRMSPALYCNFDAKASRMIKVYWGKGGDAFVRWARVVRIVVGFRSATGSLPACLVGGRGSVVGAWMRGYAQRRG